MSNGSDEGTKAPTVGNKRKKGDEDDQTLKRQRSAPAWPRPDENPGDHRIMDRRLYRNHLQRIGITRHWKSTNYSKLERYAARTGLCLSILYQDLDATIYRTRGRLVVREGGISLHSAIEGYEGENKFALQTGGAVLILPKYATAEKTKVVLQGAGYAYDGASKVGTPANIIAAIVDTRDMKEMGKIVRLLNDHAETTRSIDLALLRPAKINPDKTFFEDAFNSFEDADSVFEDANSGLHSINPIIKGRDQPEGMSVGSLFDRSKPPVVFDLHLGSKLRSLSLAGVWLGDELGSGPINQSAGKGQLSNLENLTLTACGTWVGIPDWIRELAPSLRSLRITCTPKARVKYGEAGYVAMTKIDNIILSASTAWEKLDTLSYAHASAEGVVTRYEVVLGDNPRKNFPVLRCLSVSGVAVEKLVAEQAWELPYLEELSLIPSVYGDDPKILEERMRGYATQNAVKRAMWPSLRKVSCQVGRLRKFIVDSAPRADVLQNPTMWSTDYFAADPPVGSTVPMAPRGSVEDLDATKGGGVHYVIVEEQWVRSGLPFITDADEAERVEESARFEETEQARARARAADQEEEEETQDLDLASME
jgi:hypothetical protein